MNSSDESDRQSQQAGSTPISTDEATAKQQQPEPRPTSKEGVKRTHEVHSPTDSQVAKLSRSFALAFADDPVWEYLCGSRFDRFEDLSQPFFANETRRHLGQSGVTSTTDEFAGALWSPPGQWKTRLRDAFGAAPSAIRMFGPNLLRALKTLNAVEKVHPAEPHWYLALLGTDPDHQGRGYGSAVLAPVLEHCDEEGIPAYLESSKEKNVSFYERHGFEVTGTIDIDDGEGPRMWLMWREPVVPELR